MSGNEIVREEGAEVEGRLGVGGVADGDDVEGEGLAAEASVVFEEGAVVEGELGALDLDGLAHVQGGEEGEELDGGEVRGDDGEREAHGAYGDLTAGGDR